ncbi:hypothetical protein LUZ60_003782 [Juncus effusus]|nr:hypothetical protein LUZ60_003782 [Juncus effusus]
MKMMRCFSCFSSEGDSINSRPIAISKNDYDFHPNNGSLSKRIMSRNASSRFEHENGNITAKAFTFRELANATKNFRQDCLLGEGGFGRVYKGLTRSGQIVAVKQLDKNGLQGNKEFLVEVLMLSLLHHPNLVNLVGYCADGNQRLLVYEYMRMGSLDALLLDIAPYQEPLSWYTRMKIAFGAALGLEYLHEKANPPVIYRDLKCSNILLDEEYNPKLSDFGLAKLGPMGENDIVTSRVMGTYGYCAPEYIRTGQLTSKSDVYSFGVVMLELITGRRAVDNTRPTDEQVLVTWAQPMFKDPQRYKELADPLLRGDFPEKGLNQAIAVAVMCLQEEATSRPLMTDVCVALNYLTQPPDPDANSEISGPQLSIPQIGSFSIGETSERKGKEKVDEEEDEEKREEERRRAVKEAMEWGSNSRRLYMTNYGNGSL